MLGGECIQTGFYELQGWLIIEVLVNLSNNVMMSQIDFHLFISHNTLEPLGCFNYTTKPLQYGDIPGQGSLAVLGSFADPYSIARNQYGNCIIRSMQNF